MGIDYWSIPYLTISPTVHCTAVLLYTVHCTAVLLYSCIVYSVRCTAVLCTAVIIQQSMTYLLLLMLLLHTAAASTQPRTGDKCAIFTLINGPTARPLIGWLGPHQNVFFMSLLTFGNNEAKCNHSQTFSC